jgi:RNA polymerase sigma-70 factor (ECF subfamily)
LIAIALDLLRRHWRAERRHLATWARAQAGRPDAESLPESLADELIEALDDLRAADREALLLHVWGELSYTEIAAALGCPVGTVRSRISRARGRLRTSLRLAVAAPVSAVPKESRHA